MEGFRKIDLDASFPQSESPPAITKSARPRTSTGSKKGKIIGSILIVFLLLGGVSVFTIGLPAQRIYVSAKKTYAQAKRVAEAMKNQNIDLTKEELGKTRSSLEETRKNLHSLAFLKVIPVASWYYSDADHMVKAGFYGLDSADTVVGSLIPYADVLGLKGQGSFVGGTAEQRINTAVMTLGKITPRIDAIAVSLQKAQKEIDAIDPDHYPAFLGGTKVRNQLIQMRTLADSGVLFVNEARPLIKVLPGLLGDPKEKKYLVIFQNDKELRPTGGFITFYAIFRVDKGIIHLDTSEDIYTLDNTIRGKPNAPELLQKYLKVSQLNIRDSNLSPDYVASMEEFNKLYEKSSSKREIDGIIALDTHALVSVIKILDDSIEAGGITFTTKPVEACDCPQVIYELERMVDKPRQIDSSKATLEQTLVTRKDIIGVLLKSIMEKALQSSPKLYWGPLFQALLTDTNEKHVLFYLFNADAQSGIEALNAAGRIRSFDGDYVHINDANLGGAKSNLFVKESVVMDYHVKDGTVEKTLTITYKNPYPPSDCNLERAGLCLNAELRDWIRIYVPKGSQLLSSKGSQVKVTTYEELGKTVFDGFLTVAPKGQTTYTLSYRLPFKLSSGSPLPLLIQKQPGTPGNEFTIMLNGKEVEKSPLLTDREIKLKP